MNILINFFLIIM